MALKETARRTLTNSTGGKRSDAVWPGRSGMGIGHWQAGSPRKPGEHLSSTVIHAPCISERRESPSYCQVGKTRLKSTREKEPTGERRGKAARGCSCCLRETDKVPARLPGHSPPGAPVVSRHRPADTATVAEGSAGDAVSRSILPLAVRGTRRRDEFRRCGHGSLEHGRRPPSLLPCKATTRRSEELPRTSPRIRGRAG